ncbi:MAG: DUF4031 domain-containing protein [Burkholderiaceae bacterium]|nr:DUF4031 domain-containing protein [Burkholderiaceae bacterium]
MVYVDNTKNERHGREWSHLVADSIEELHQFAARHQLPRSWFHATAKYPHYDVTQWARRLALNGGAIPIARRDLILKARALRDQPLRPKAAGSFLTESLNLFD